MQLGKLFMEARQYGRVRIFTTDSGKYHCAIKFNTIEHTELEAKSTFEHLTPEEAVSMAINSAAAIVASIRSMPVNDKIKQLEQPSKGSEQ